MKTLAILFTLLIATGCGKGFVDPQTPTETHALTLRVAMTGVGRGTCCEPRSPRIYEINGSIVCRTERSRIGTATPFTIYDAKGEIIATGKFDATNYDGGVNGNSPASLGMEGTSCVVEATPQVPTSSFYRLSIKGSDITLSAQDLIANNWVVLIS